MEKEQYIDVVNDVLKGDAKRIMLEQIEHFYNLSSQTIKHPKYKIGDVVKLPKDTYLHGFGSEIKLLDLFAKGGLINKDFEFGVSKHMARYCVSLWRIHKATTLRDYITLYSGMEVDVEGEHFLVPYRGLDAFVEKMRYFPHFLWQAESSMEIRFMPSLARDKNQLAFIINGRDRLTKPLLANDVLNDQTISWDTLLSFFSMKDEKKKEELKNNRHLGFFKRTAYVLFGIPACMIEGVLVGRKFEKNSKILKHIKEMLPNSYICNLDGKVLLT